jgi:hypothetical protein
MPHEIIGEAVVQVAQGAAEIAVDEVHRKFGWKGCLTLTAIIVGIGAGLFFTLR